MGFCALRSGFVNPLTEPQPVSTAGMGGTLSRTSSGLLRREDWASLSGWTVSANYALNSDNPLYAAHRSTHKVIRRKAGRKESLTIRDPVIVRASDSLWYLAYDTADKGVTNDPWWAHLARSSNRGRTWERLGKMTSLSHGSHLSVDYPVGFINGGDGFIYIFPLYTDTHTNNVPASPLIGQSYRMAASTFLAGLGDGGTWTWIQDIPTLGSAGQFDDSLACAGSVVNISGTWHLWYSAQDGGTTATTVYTGHGTFGSTLDSTFTKDGLGANDHADVNNNSGTGGRPENPYVFQSSALGKWAKTCNNINSDGDHTNANDVYLAADWDEFSASTAYRVQMQYETKDSVGPIGILQPISDTDGAIDFESDGAIGVVFDCNDDNDDDHQHRDIAWGQMEAWPSSLKFTAPTPGTLGTVEYAVRSLAHTDIIIEFVITFADDLTTVYNAGLFYRHDGTTSDTGADGYVLDITTVAGSGGMALYRCDNGSFTQLALSSIPPYHDLDTKNLRTNRVRVECKGDTHIISLNGHRLIHHTDTSVNKKDSGTHLSFRSAGSVCRVHGFVAYTSKLLTISGCPANAPVILRGAGGAVWVLGTADSSGVVTLSSDHYPLYSVEVAGVTLTPTEPFYGGDVYEIVAGTVESPSPVSVTSSVVAPTTSLSLAGTAVGSTSAVASPTVVLTSAGGAISQTGSVVAGTASITSVPSPVSLPGSVVAPAVTLTRGMNAVSFTGQAVDGTAVVTVAPAALGTTATVTTATLTTSFAPDPVTGTLAVAAPTLTLTVAATPIVITTTLPAPSTDGSTVLNPGAISVTSTVAAPTSSLANAGGTVSFGGSVVTGDPLVTAVPGPTSLTTASGTPQVTLTPSVAPTGLLGAVVAPAMSLTNAGGVVTVTTSPAGQTPSVTFAPSSLATTATVPAVTTSAGFEIAPEPVTSSLAVVSPATSLAYGAVAVTILGTVPAPTITSALNFTVFRTTMFATGLLRRADMRAGSYRRAAMDAGLYRRASLTARTVR